MTRFCHKAGILALSCMSALMLASCSGRSHHASQATSDTVMRPLSHFNYRDSSEKRPYPKKLARDDRIVVSEAKQRAYLQRPANYKIVSNGHKSTASIAREPDRYKTVYTFYVSTGKDVSGRRTPKGHYRINMTRTPWFYSPGEHEGANNAVGFHDGGLYLFHETPSDQNGRIIKPVAKELGLKGTSYGCVHLSVPDSQWFYNHVKTGMLVIIK